MIVAHECVTLQVIYLIISIDSVYSQSVGRSSNGSEAGAMAQDDTAPARVLKPRNRIMRNLHVMIGNICCQYQYVSCRPPARVRSGTLCFMYVVDIVQSYGPEIIFAAELFSPADSNLMTDCRQVCLT